MTKEHGTMQPKGTIPKGYRHKPNYGHDPVVRSVVLNNFRVILTGNASTELMSVVGEAMRGAKR